MSSELNDIEIFPKFFTNPELNLIWIIVYNWEYSVYPRPLAKIAVIGGWWLICSAYMGQPSIKAWKVSPRIGLKGFYIWI